MREKQHTIPVSKEAYERFCQLVKQAKEDHPANRLKRKDLGTLAVNNLTTEQAIELSRRNRSLKVLINSYFSNEEDTPSPEKLLSLLQQQIKASCNDN